MTFLSYSLPKGAPQRLVWFAECDKCRKATLGPFGNTPNQQQQMRQAVVDAGWRYQGEHPMDTCPSCLAAEQAAVSTETALEGVENVTEPAHA